MKNLIENAFGDLVERTDYGNHKNQLHLFNNYRVNTRFNSGKWRTRIMKNLIIFMLLLVIYIMNHMDVTPDEFLHLATKTLPNYLKYKLV